MGTQKSNFAYRLAWANTSSERIPFLPLHRRDLVFAEEGNRTYLSGDVERINWKKFDIMGDVIVGIQKSQGTPYPDISRNDEVQRLILDGIFSKDDDVSIPSKYYYSYPELLTHPVPLCVSMTLISQSETAAELTC